jgi:hypothetical protein
LDSKLITRMVIAGGLVGVIGIALFFGLWVVLGAIPTTPFVRVVLSVCLPPIILATIFGMYYLVVRPGSATAAISKRDTSTNSIVEVPTDTPAEG